MFIDIWILCISTFVYLHLCVSTFLYLFYAFLSREDDNPRRVN